MGMVLEAASDKVLFALISAILLAGAIGGNYAQPEEKIDIYDYKMGQIEQKMKVVIADPTDANIKAVYYDLMEEMQWSQRHIGERSDEYEAYLESCNDVLISLSKGEYTAPAENVKIDNSYPFVLTPVIQK